MKINSVCARNYDDSAFKKAAFIFSDYFISDARYLSLVNKHVLAISCGKICLPLTSEVLKNIYLKDYFNSFNDSLLLSNKGLNIVLVTSNGKIHEIDEKAYQILAEILKSFEHYGGYLDEQGNQVIDLKSKEIGPHYTTNLLLGNRMHYKNPLLTTPKSVVNAFGGGSFRGEAAYQVLATRWDIRPEENGNPFNRQFYILEDGVEIFYSGEIFDNVIEANCKHCANKTVITYKLTDLLITRKIFIIPQEKGLPSATECQTIEVKNLSNKKRNLAIVCTGMFGLSNPGCQQVDIIYQTVITQTRILKNENNQIIGLTPDYYPKYFKDNMRFVILKDDKSYIDSYTQDSTEFLGNGDIAHPNGLNNMVNNPRFSGSSFFALRKDFTLSRNENHVFDQFVGVTSIEKEDDIYEKMEREVGKLLVKFNKHFKVEEELNLIDTDYKNYCNYLQIQSDDKTFNTYVNNTLPFQVLYQTFVSRSFAQTQKGYREIGFREVQDLYASMYYLVGMGEKELVKKLLSCWIENVYSFGYANHNFYYEGKEPGMCSDDQLWLVQAVYRYVALTDDYEFLNENFKIAGMKKKRTLIETLKAIVYYSSSISVGKHNIPLLDCCDWNDCLRIDDDYLDGPHKEKAYNNYLRKNHILFGVPFESNYSESVMNGFLLVIAEQELKELLKDKKEIADLDVLINKEKSALNKYAYINDYFARVLVNKDTPNHNKYIGSKGDGLSLDPNIDGSYYLNSFSWSLLSNVANEDMILKMMDSVDKYLKTKAGFILCSNSDLSKAGSKQASSDHYFVGDRENGGVFKHATMMMAVAMLRKSKDVKSNELKERLLDDAYYMLDLVLPYKTLENPFVLKGNPRFCTQYNNSKTCENIGPILSGTASWLTLAIYEILGIDFNKDSITINPALSKKTHTFNARIRLEKAVLNIKISKESDEYCNINKATILLDNKNHNNVFPKFNDQREHFIEIKY